MVQMVHLYKSALHFIGIINLYFRTPNKNVFVRTPPTICTISVIVDVPQLYIQPNITPKIIIYNQL